MKPGRRGRAFGSWPTAGPLPHKSLHRENRPSVNWITHPLTPSELSVEAREPTAQKSRARIDTSAVNLTVTLSTNPLIQELQMANGFNSFGQAQAFYAIISMGYTPMSPIFHKSDNTWTCFAMKEAVLYSVVAISST